MTKPVFKSFWQNDTIEKLSELKPPPKKSGQYEAKLRKHTNHKKSDQK
jgi:hypothetical protein